MSFGKFNSFVARYNGTWCDGSAQRTDSSLRFRFDGATERHNGPGLPGFEIDPTWPNGFHENGAQVLVPGSAVVGVPERLEGAADVFVRRH